MTKAMVMVLFLFSLNSVAQIRPPNYCTSSDLSIMHEAFI